MSDPPLPSDAATGPPAVTARQAALAVLVRVLSHRPGRAGIERPADLPGLDDREKGLACELILGVLRHQLTLRHVLAVVAGRRPREVNPRLWPILLMAAYQLIWLDGIPAFAAVHEAVDQAKCAGGARAGGFVNAVLRGLERQIEHRRIAQSQAEATRSIPVDFNRACQFRLAVLPDPEQNPVEYLAISTSHPAWLVHRWITAFGPDNTRRICMAGLCRPAMVLRPNRLRTDLDVLAGRLRQEGIETARDEQAGVLIAAQAAALLHTSAFAEGLFQIQDRTAMRVVRAMAPRPGQTILDLCAGVGTKTTQMAEIMDNTGLILASDKDEDRLAMIRENCHRLGIRCVTTVPTGSWTEVCRRLDRLDWILVDVPCSNTGVLARRCEARYRVSARSLASLATLQLELLEQADRLARPHTRLAYSTCSLEAEENEAVVAGFSQNHPRWRLTRSERTLPAVGPTPADWHDGGFWAVWEPA